MLQIVCLASDIWSANNMRFRHLTADLQSMEVLYFEPYQNIMSELRRPSEGKLICSNTRAFTLPKAIKPDEDVFFGIKSSSKSNVSFIIKCMIDCGFQKPLIWVEDPCYAEMLNEMLNNMPDNPKIVYDCNKFCNYPIAFERDLLELSDVVFASSTELLRHLRQYKLRNNNFIFVPDGVDYSLYSSAEFYNINFCPVDIKSIMYLRKPIFGYIGQVNDFTDLSPVKYASEQHSDWSFVFVGYFSKRNKYYKYCKKSKNIYIMGEKNESSIPRYLACFNVCFSLLDLSYTNDYYPPEQLLIYLCSGKPIVTVERKNLEGFFPDLTCSSHFDIEFMSACELALTEDMQLLREKRMKTAKQFDWADRSRKVKNVLDNSGLLAENRNGFFIVKNI